jgi:hypothetical protein
VTFGAPGAEVISSLIFCAIGDLHQPPRIMPVAGPGVVTGGKKCRITTWLPEPWLAGTTPVDGIWPSDHFAIVADLKQ